MEKRGIILEPFGPASQNQLCESTPHKDHV